MLKLKCGCSGTKIKKPLGYVIYNYFYYLPLFYKPLHSLSETIISELHKINNVSHIDPTNLGENA